RDHYRDIAEQVVLGEQLGYSGAWVTEHHLNSRGEIPDPLQLLAYLAGRTSTIRLGSSIVCAPFYHPLRLLESALQLDAISGGRLDLGVGSGTGTPEFFRLWGVEREEASDRAAEIAAILAQGINTGRVSHHGTYYDLEVEDVRPLSDRPARDVVWTAAGRHAVELGREHGFRLMIPRPLPLEERLRINREYRAAVPDGEVIHLRSGLVAPTTEEARRDAVEFLREYARIYLKLEWTGGPDSAQFDEIAERLSFAVGTAAQVADQVRTWTDEFDGTEVTAIQFEGPGLAQSTVLRSIELFAAELPALQADATARSLSTAPAALTV
ncbi:MAG: LLM class flavin-dependent oxidoreductase, partial [Mycetocola sp.]